MSSVKGDCFLFIVRSLKMRKTHLLCTKFIQRSATSSHSTGARVRSQPSFRLVLVKAEIVVKTDKNGEVNREIVHTPTKSIPLMKGMDRDTAKKSCDMMQEECDRECKPIRVYIHIGADPVPVYAGLAGATK